MTLKLNRRQFVQAAGGAVALSGIAPYVHAASKAKARVVIIGGGFAGGTTAKFIRRLDPSISVTLVERSKKFITCPFSNAVIGGLIEMDHITHTYDSLRTRWGVNVVHQSATQVDPVKKIVTLANGDVLAYDKLVVAPGIDINWTGLAGYDEAAAELAPHAWKAGAQTLLLRDQLRAMKDGGVVIMSAPANPFRCPPGPYERASLIANYLKKNKPKSKLLLLDAKENFSKQGLFTDAWASQFPGIVEWVPLSKDGKVVRVDAKTKSVETEFGTIHKADVLNIIPPQKAGAIAQVTGLTNESGWVAVKPETFESVAHKDVFVVGDATIANPMPKSGFVANAHGKVLAATLVAQLNGKDNPTPLWANTCYSLIHEDYGITVAGVYQAGAKGFEEIPGSGGVSKKEASAAERQLEARYAFDWYSSITKEIWHN